MSVSLHDQLAEELNCSPDDAERALRDYLETIAARVRRGETVSVPGLGTFTASDEGLHFSPSASLQDAVNYRNAGLSPLPVSDEPDAPPSPTALYDAPPEDDTDTDTDEPVTDAPIDEDVTEETTAEATEDAPPADAVPDLSDDWATELDADEKDEAEATSDAERPDSKPAARPQAASPSADDNAPSTGQVVGLAASILLLLAAIGYVLFTQGIFTRSGSPETSGSASAPAQPDTVAATPAPSDTDAAADDTTAVQATPDTGAAPGSDDAQSTIDRAAGGWTIVVASRTNPNQAQAVLATYRQRFQNEDLPVDILTGESGEQLRYRVTVGQYPSREAAQAAQDQLTGRIPDDAWPLAIQPDS